MGQNKVYIIGHKQPDTDSICSVIGYAELLNHTEPGKYIPARCGEVGPEARFALETFNVEPPVYIASVEPTSRTSRSIPGAPARISRRSMWLP